ncbi:Mitochondrial tRNAs modification protein [Exophiala xenobiotica]|uniref:Mitochondrial tRNAs modification protein n=1 Tax=Vermiconidia calcicola TaxID=1690605 RepID=A0AAV9QFW3_9PEZI|nr:Mitochondrial tRNAs modification protein [Exophiala xenobiotica]KAK5539843.1 Mitochondrial tRNAs modification protein [Vermiconidia calcicola]KAK5547037.1 Mitochondrial tRNAs modification protein [Chaetothyriales sp. CCFEE 6169]KAK5199768.1 Mitochondrial tRNAs modification protein [Exophiala xenobiotica]KAK5210935.1 Mitochondrial tRNAs modification protein [Exophiala xenobiotica]
MYRSQLVARRLAPQLTSSARTATPIRTFVSSSPRTVGGPTTGPSNDGYKHGKDGKKPIREHPKDDDSLPNYVESKLGEREEPRGKASMGSGGKSHATGESVVPESVQRVAPEKLEKALPESVHPTKGSEIDPDPNQNKSAR